MRPVVMGALILLALSGCTVTPGPVPHAKPNPPSFDIGCASAVSLPDLKTVWGDGLAPSRYDEAGAGGTWPMQATALLQDGALACAWSLPGSERPQVLVIALDDAEDGFVRSEPGFLDGSVFPYTTVSVGDAGEAFCRNDNPDAGIQCHWNVLAENVWLSVLMQGLPASEMVDGYPVPDSVTSSIVSEIAVTLTESDRLPGGQIRSDLPSCDASLPAAAVAEILGLDPSAVTVVTGRPVEESLGKSNPTFGQVMWAYSFERRGYSECAVITEEVHATAMVAPGASWILDEANAVQPALTEVDDFGPGVEYCTSEGSFLLCTIAVAVGRDLVLAEVVSSSDAEGLEQALSLVNLLART